MQKLAMLLAMGTIVRAYINPTSGGMLLQLLLGGSAALLVVRRLIKTEVLSVIRKRSKPSQKAPVSADRK